MVLMVKNLIPKSAPIGSNLVGLDVYEGPTAIDHSFFLFKGCPGRGQTWEILVFDNFTLLIKLI